MFLSGGHPLILQADDFKCWAPFLMQADDFKWWAPSYIASFGDTAL